MFGIKHTLEARMAEIQQESKRIADKIMAPVVDPRVKEQMEAMYEADRRELKGYGVIGKRVVNKDWERRVVEAAHLIGQCASGKKDIYFFKEAMTTSDFPNLMGDVMYRMLLGNYTAWPTTFQNWCRVVKAKDFRSLHMYTLDGGQGLLSVVKEQAPYPETSFTETAYSVAVSKYGRRFSLSFELLTNDDLNAFMQRPRLMALAVRRTQEQLATTMICDSNGPHATLFTAGHNNIVTGNPRLTIQGLQTAYAVLAAQTDLDGQPIIIPRLAMTNMAMVAAVTNRPRSSRSVSCSLRVVSRICGRRARPNPSPTFC